MYNRFRLFLPLFSVTLALFFGTATYAQISNGGTPLLLSSAPELQDVRSKPPKIGLKAPDKTLLEAEDRQRADANRFAAPIWQQIDLNKDGRWTELPDSGRVWHLHFSAKNALGLIFYFEQLDLKEGTRLFAFSPDGTQIHGAYTQESMTPQGAFTIGPLTGSEAFLEIFEPAEARGTTTMNLRRIEYAYNQNLFYKPVNEAENFGFGFAAPCQVNINCPRGNDWQQEKKGIARIMMTFDNGTGWCTGSLMANTSMDRTPNLLTAFHCIDNPGLTPWYFNWKFDFGFESANCNNPVFPPVPNTIVGCNPLVGWVETDYLLLRLNPIPDFYDVYYNGWNRSRAVKPLRSTMIHHPAGDIKKISIDKDSATLFPQEIIWSNSHVSGSWTHFKVVFDTGYFQPGSSGAPVFDENKRIYAQLHGGDFDPNNPCTVGSAYFARLSLSWDASLDTTKHLSTYLDPNNTGLQVIDGYKPFDPKIAIGGRIRSTFGHNMKNVPVKLTYGTQTKFSFTDSLGRYQFTELPLGENYTVEPSKDDQFLKGVTSNDMVKMRRAIDGVEVLSPWNIIAGDVNNDNQLNAADILDIQKLGLGLTAVFPNTTAWRFYHAHHQFPNPTNPFANMPQQTATFPNLNVNRYGNDFKGVKVGDLDHSISPNQ